MHHSTLPPQAAKESARTVLDMQYKVDGLELDNNLLVDQVSTWRSLEQASNHRSCFSACRRSDRRALAVESRTKLCTMLLFAA